MTASQKPRPTEAELWALLEALPGHLKGEIIDGELHVRPRPRPRQARVIKRMVHPARTLRMRDGAFRRLMRGNGLLLSAVVAGTSACARDAASTKLGTDDGGSGGGDTGTVSFVDSGAEMEMNQTVGSGTAGCNPIEGEAPLEMLPEYVTVFQHVPSLCDPIGSGVSVRNVGTSPLRINGASVLPSELSMETDSIPIELPPGASFAVRLYFDSLEVGEQPGALQVSTSQGCRQFDVLGLSTSGALLTRSHEVIDFGRVQAGSSSDIQRLTLITERIATDPRVSYGAFSTDNPEVFEIVAAPESRVESVDCRPVELSLRVRAPAEVGPINGNIVWRTLVGPPAQPTAEATMITLLYAEVIAPTP
jgi:hypothetical protein